MAEEYEVLPHQLLRQLKEEVESLKKKLLQPDTKSNELLLEIEGLKDIIHDLQDTFRKALDQAQGEDLGKTMSSLKEGIDKVVSQNETIARALVAISDKLDKSGEPAPFSVPRPQPMSQGPSFGAPSFGAPSFGMPPPPFGAPTRNAPPLDVPTPTLDLPPPPRRKGIFK